MFSLRCNLHKPFLSILLCLFVSVSSAMEVPVYDFSIKSYTQNIGDHIPSDSDDYSTGLLKPEYQDRHYVASKKTEARFGKASDGFFLKN